MGSMLLYSSTMDPSWDWDAPKKVPKESRNNVIMGLANHPSSVGWDKLTMFFLAVSKGIFDRHIISENVVFHGGCAWLIDIANLNNKIWNDLEPWNESMTCILKPPEMVSFVFFVRRRASTSHRSGPALFCLFWRFLSRRWWKKWEVWSKQSGKLKFSRQKGAVFFNPTKISGDFGWHPWVKNQAKVNGLIEIRS